MIFQIRNAITGEFEYYDNVGLARAALTSIKSNYLEQEKSRFTICKITVSGNDTVWSEADLINDPEYGEYRVFNQYTGQHESIGSLTLARMRRDEIINNFTIENNLDVVTELAEKPVPPVSTLGQF